MPDLPTPQPQPMFAINAWADGEVTHPEPESDPEETP